jgi:superfamily II RNA helicase
MKFKQFVLDQFQVDAIASVDNGNSVVVSAGTGTGKTLIADYIIDKYLQLSKRVVYTAPIKALSGQKYRDFKKEYGEENVGIMTGDIVINPDAPILIMTTEIYRNMLLTQDPIIEHVSYVVFDEIHFINDIERGTVWEESIIFSPAHVRFLCLSATIPNAPEFAEWIETIKKHKVDVVVYEKRAVPLEHYVYDAFLGITTPEEVMKDRRNTEFVKEKRKQAARGGKRGKKADIPRADHVQLITRIEDKLPAIVFDFSRKSCEEKAVELAKRKDFLDNSQRAKVAELANHLITGDYRGLESVHKLKYVLSRGIAFHHAGLLPKAKELVEVLFAQGIIKVLYATETFAVGINMPAKTVVFASLEKFDGINFRYLNSKEYFQLAGRAGRRGIDTKGYAISMVERGFTDMEKIKRLSLKDDIPIQSQFKLSVNTILNLVFHHPPAEREKILKMNFDFFQKQRGATHQIRIIATYNNKMKTLKSMGYVQDDKLTEKGRFASKIYSNEMLVTELFCSDLYTRLSDDEINILVAACIYEPRRTDYFSMKGIDREYSHLMKIISERSYLAKNLNKLHVKRMVKVIGEFSRGADFTDILELSSLDEGDLIRLIRRVIDMIRQINHATEDYELRERLHSCMGRLYRDVVKFEF